MEKNWDPGVKKFFIKILNSISLGLLWMMACAMAGIYYELGYIHGKPVWQPLVFYTAMLVSLVFLIRYFIRVWKQDK
jgi:hypothetical protein